MRLSYHYNLLLAHIKRVDLSIPPWENIFVTNFSETTMTVENNKLPTQNQDIKPVATGVSETGMTATLYAPSFDQQTATEWLLSNGMTVIYPPGH